MNFKEYTQSQSFKGVLVGISLTLVALVIFQAGVSVGVHKASFANRLGDNFERNFGPTGRDAFMPPDFPGERRGLPGGHGAVGEIVSTALPEIIVSGMDNVEKTILVTDKTIVREFRDELTPESLSVGTHIVVLGSPNDDGQIEATLIRILPAPGEEFSFPSTGTSPSAENI